MSAVGVSAGEKNLFKNEDIGWCRTTQVSSNISCVGNLIVLPVAAAAAFVAELVG